MPKENKHSRGRREEKKEKKRKREKGDDEEETLAPKRRKSLDPAAIEDANEEGNEDVQFTGVDNANTEVAAGGTTERPFYGMLEDEEQEYFRRADELLELNDFPSAEERSLFLANVYREADGKELKIACSQSCSRLMERLVLLSTAEQKKKLFEKFAGNFSHLIQHRFASHCCETLFIQSAPVVTQELTADTKKNSDTEDGEEGEGEALMESLFLATLDELEGQMTFLLTDRFASHTLRVLLVILSGRPLEKSSTRSLLQSKKKEKITVGNMDSTPTEFSLGKRAVPESFEFAVEKIISDTIATMDSSFIRVLATHTTGNPTLQLLLELELTNPNTKKGVNSNQKTIISSLLPDDFTEGSESLIFINGILYDAIGSRLLETICTHAPGKLFKQIYKAVFKDRIAGLARNEISSYVVIKVLNRISKEELEEAVTDISPQILGLVQRSRTMIIKTLLERCYARRAKKSIETLTASIASAYGSDSSTLLLKMACIDDIDYLIKATTSSPALPPSVDEPLTEGKVEEESAPIIAPLKPTSPQIHGSLLAQTMLTIPNAPPTLIQNSLFALSSPKLLALSLFTPTSHILQSAFTPTEANTLFRRKLINALLFPPSQLSTTTTTPQDPILLLSISPTGSHILDSILHSTASTTPLFTLTERIASSLSAYEHILRESIFGRIVWRNWLLDLFNRRRGEWVNNIKALGLKMFPPSESTASTKNGTENIKEKETKEAGWQEKKKAKNSKNKNGKGPNTFETPQQTGPKKSAIQLAREKFAVRKQGGDSGFDKNKNNKRFGTGKGTGANQVVARGKVPV